MKRLWKWLSATAASFGIVFTGAGGLAQKAADVAGLDDTLLGQAFRDAFGVAPAVAQQLSFYTFLDAQLAAAPGPAPLLPSELQAILLAAISAYVAAGGTDLPTPAELALRYPQYPGIALAFVDALQAAVLAGIIPPVLVQLALAGDLS